MFWPGMSMQITDLVSKCLMCNTRNCSEPMIGHVIPQRPEQKVGSDLYEFDSEQYIVLVDYYSNFIDMDKVKTLKAKLSFTSASSISMIWYTCVAVADLHIRNLTLETAGAASHQVYLLVLEHLVRKSRSPRYPLFALHTR